MVSEGKGIMTYDPERHHRHSIRLKGYDYAQAGAYFVTICTHNRECLFGDVVDGTMRLNEFGDIVYQTWMDLPNHVANIVLDAFVIMPNHVHGVIFITDSVGAGSEPAPTITTTEPAPTMAKPGHAELRRHPLPEIVRQFKTFSARRINELRGTPGISVWQRNYYEHIIRDESSLNRIRQYIQDNPLRWAMDRENPDAIEL